MLLVFVLTAILETGMHAGTDLWRARKVLAIVLAAATLFMSADVLRLRWNVLSLLFVLAGLYRIFNDARLMKGRMHERYLQRATRRTAFVLIALQVAIGVLWLTLAHIRLGEAQAWIALAAAQFLVAAILCASTIRRLRRTRWPQVSARFSDAQLPSITVAIPARNETDTLAACLQSIIASDYPKLEIIVLDDCSQIKRTPEIIRGFAHDGVRFVQGEQPRPTWLPKNQAYARLVEEASGMYILFCGVDMHFEPGTIRQIVDVMLARRKKMLDIVPMRDRRAYGRFTLVQAVRYAWELMPPRRFFGRPAVLGSCWMIDAQALKKAGGFEAVSRSIVPEAYFARRLAKLDAYSFLRSGTRLGLSSAKSAAEQRATAIRTRYPQLHRWPEHVLAATLLEFVLLVLPFGLAIAAVAGASLPALAKILAIAACVLLALAYECIARATHINTWWFAFVALPIMTLSDIALLHYSMWRYEFSIVEWKGRNICIPAMHVIPHLPKT